MNVQTANLTRHAYRRLAETSLQILHLRINYRADLRVIVVRASDLHSRVVEGSHAGIVIADANYGCLSAGVSERRNSCSPPSPFSPRIPLCFILPFLLPPPTHPPPHPSPPSSTPESQSPDIKGSMWHGLAVAVAVQPKSWLAG